MMIIINKVSMIFNSQSPLVHHALKDINLHIPEKQLISIVGGNGAGKSTLMKLLSGELVPSRGTIQLEGTCLSRFSKSRHARMMGKVMQDPMRGTFSDLTIEENLSLALCRGEKRKLWFALGKKRREYFVETMKQYGIRLENKLSTPMRLLSGGQRQALSLMMAMLNSPQILLLDEHTSALDARMSQEMMSLTHRCIHENHLTAIMVTHDLSHALKYSSRIVVLNSGTLIKDYSLEDLKCLTINDLHRDISAIPEKGVGC